MEACLLKVFPILSGEKAVKELESKRNLLKTCVACVVSFQWVVVFVSLIQVISWKTSFTMSLLSADIP